MMDAREELAIAGKALRTLIRRVGIEPTTVAYIATRPTQPR